MKLYVFAVRDRATDQFDRPMFMLSTGQAIRAFGDGVNDRSRDNAFGIHPEDYDLYLLGEFETNTGFFVTGVPEQVAIGKDLVIPVLKQ